MVTRFISHRPFSLDVAVLPKACPSSGLSFLSIDGKCVVVSSTWMADVIGATAERDPFQFVVHIENQRGLNTNGRMQ